MLRMSRTGQLARSFGTFHAIYPSLTISPFPVGNPGTRNCEADTTMIHGIHVEEKHRTIHNRRSRGPSVSGAMQQGGLTLAGGSEPSDGLRRKTSIQLGLMHVSKLHSGKADGVSAQHTERSLLTSRELQAVAPSHSYFGPASILDGESFASAQRQKIHRACGTRPNQRFSAHVRCPLGVGHGAVCESRTCQHRSFL